MRILLWERKLGREDPTSALVDEVWVRLATSEMVRVLLHSEVKLVSASRFFEMAHAQTLPQPCVARAREMVSAVVDPESEQYLYEMANVI
jgi:hypothetical protein